MGIKRRCQSCGNAYTAERDTSLYCGPACRKRESRKRQAGDPEAIAAVRVPGAAAISAPTGPPAQRLVTLMLAPGTTVELPPDLAAKIAPHLPVPGESTPWGADERQPWRQERTGDRPSPHHPMEVDTDEPQPATGGPVIIDAADLAAMSPQQLRGQPATEQPSPAALAEQERRRREDAYSQTEEDLWEALENHHSIAASTREALGARISTPLGRNALMLAMRLDYGRLERSSALAALSREYRATLAAALQEAGEAEDELDRVRRERAERAARLAAGR